MIRGPTLLPQVVFQMKERLRIKDKIDPTAFYRQTCLNGGGKSTTNSGGSMKTPSAAGGSGAPAAAAPW